MEHTEDAKRRIGDAVRRRWQRDKEHASLVTYAIDEALRLVAEVDAIKPDDLAAAAVRRYEAAREALANAAALAEGRRIETPDQVVDRLARTERTEPMPYAQAATVARMIEHGSGSDDDRRARLYLACLLDARADAPVGQRRSWELRAQAAAAGRRVKTSTFPVEVRP